MMPLIPWAGQKRNRRSMQCHARTRILLSDCCPPHLWSDPQTQGLPLARLAKLKIQGQGRQGSWCRQACAGTRREGVVPACSACAKLYVLAWPTKSLKGRKRRRKEDQAMESRKQGHVSEIDKAEQVPSDPVQTRYQLWLRHGFHLQEAGPSQSGGKSCCRQKGPLPGSQGRRLRGIDDSIGSRT